MREIITTGRKRNIDEDKRSFCAGRKAGKGRKRGPCGGKEEKENRAGTLCRMNEKESAENGPEAGYRPGREKTFPAQRPVQAAARACLFALCILGLAAGVSGCGIRGEAGVIAQGAPQTGAAGQEEKDGADYGFRERFYALSPDSLEILELDEAKEAVEQERYGWGLVLAEFPEDDTAFYGYMDGEKPRQGVMIRCGDNVSYFPDIVYMSEEMELPDIYLDRGRSLMVASFHAESGRSRERDTLYAFSKSAAGTVTGEPFRTEDYLGQMENRFSLSYQPGEDTGKLVGQNGEMIAGVDLSWAGGAAITGLNVVDRVRFTAGNPAKLQVEIGITAEGRAPYYGENITVTAPVELVCRSYGDGLKKVSFLIGEVTEYEGPEQADAGGAGAEAGEE